MSAQPEVLRLADALQQQAVWEGHYGPSYLRDLLPEAAAELRRLHAENERLKTVPMKYRRMEFNAQLQAENERLIAQRDALLEACKAYDQWADKTLCYDRVLRPIRAQIRAAINAVEGEKK